VSAAGPRRKSPRDRPRAASARSHRGVDGTPAWRLSWPSILLFIFPSRNSGGGVRTARAAPAQSARGLQQTLARESPALLPSSGPRLSRWLTSSGRLVVHRDGVRPLSRAASHAAYRSHAGSASRSAGHRFKDRKNANHPRRPPFVLTGGTPPSPQRNHNRNAQSGERDARGFGACF
jgi:hypothetical protein